MAKIKNTGFFGAGVHAGNENEIKIKEFQDESITEKPTSAAVKPASASKQSVAAEPVNMQQRMMTESRILPMLREISSSLSDSGFETDAREIDALCKEANDNKFSIAVVGEFSKGKSRFVNSLIGRDILPVGNLPTTSMLTRVRGSANEAFIVFDANGRKIASLPLKAELLEEFTGSDVSREIEYGMTFAGIRNEWLTQNNIEIVDTPGTEDSFSEKAGIIGRALNTGSCAIITISADSAMSMTERAFIEERLIRCKIPYLMLIITKLDLVPKAERPMVIDHVTRLLKPFGVDIPVFVPYDTEMPDGNYDSIIGMEKVKKCIEKWIVSCDRVAMKDRWLTARADTVLKRRLASLNERLAIIGADEKKRAQFISEKRILLTKAITEWNNIRSEMTKRRDACIDKAKKQVSKAKKNAVTNMKYEINMNKNIKEWVEKSYPFRKNKEIQVLSSMVDDLVVKNLNADTAWMTNSIARNYKTALVVQKSGLDELELIDRSDDTTHLGNVELKDMNKRQNVARVITSAVTLLAAGGMVIATAMTGGLATALPVTMVATLGVPTVSSIITGKIFTGSIEKQREELCAAIEADIPKAIDSATKDMCLHINELYGEFISWPMKNRIVGVSSRKR